MKPAWLNKKINLRDCSQIKQILRTSGLNTVCEQAMCPNIGECFAQKVATFLILGKNCTRNCNFCNIQKAKPLPPDLDEPERVAQVVKSLSLKHVVVTSVTRDDLADGGAGIFADTVNRISQQSPETAVELLIPDFGFSVVSLKTVVASSPQIIAHNLETVPSLYKLVRQGADYQGSLGLLRTLKEIAPQIKSKSGLMVGLGERKEEILEVMNDLRSVGCDLLSIGQYLSPSQKHYPVKDYIRPSVFDDYKAKALKLGFLHIESGPYVRSSYLAGEYLT